MDKRINKIIDNYITTFKTDIKTLVDRQPTTTPQDIIKLIYDYDKLTLSKEDFTKRKRTKNHILTELRCCAKRANGLQCTRRKKDTYDFCGTHIKATPHGTFTPSHSSSSTTKIELTPVDQHGIIYYTDSHGQLFDIETIMKFN